MRRKAEVKQESQENQDLVMMADPSKWPCWPWLPMKRDRAGDRETAVLHADDFPDKPAYLYKINLFEIRSYFPTPEMEKTQQYDNFAAMLVDGWKVD
jgi:hypothetical protein